MAKARSMMCFRSCSARLPTSSSWSGRTYSDFPIILDSIRERLLVLPMDTRRLTGHGDETTIGAEAASYEDWVLRGH
jgi:hypothetical protein